MKVISFNVNGIRSRLHQVQAVIEKHQPDVIGIQEIKCANDVFPIDDITAMGYKAQWHGQKGYHGVALLSKTEPVRVQKGFASDAEDAQKRLILADYEVDGKTFTVINGYFPQGESRAHPDKFPAKEKFYADLSHLLDTEYSPEQNLVVIGDMNIAPNDIDIGIGEKNAKRWLRTGKCSFLPEEREWIQKIYAWGLEDTYLRLANQDQFKMSWFDYRSKGFEDDPKRGLRIDLILATLPLVENCTEVGIDHEIRGMEKPSDHCPVWAVFE